MTPEGPRPTRGQQLALDHSRNLSVTAGAGTGKTWVLAERFVGLLADDPDLTPPQILAVTFTKKAAAEMRVRIAKRLRQKIDDARTEQDADALRRWIHHRRALAHATITTIHGLAAEILRASALEAGLDPAFSILEGADADELQAEAIRDTLRSDEATTREGLTELYQHRAPSVVRAALEALLVQRDFADAWAAHLEHTPDDVLLAAALQHAVPLSPAQWHAFLEKTLDDAAAIRGRRGLLPADAAAHATFDALDACDAARDGTPTQQHAAVYALWDTSRSSQGQWYKAPPVAKKKDWSTAGGADDAAAFYKALVERFDTLLAGRTLPPAPGAPDRRLLSECRTLAHLYRSCAQRYDAAKAERNSLDFHDLVQRAADLLRVDSRAERIRRRYRHLMIDEFQDTDARQWSLIAALARDDPPPAGKRRTPDPASAWQTGDEAADPRRTRASSDAAGPRSSSALLEIEADDGPPGLAPGRLFIVGDEKQSIYGFRGADIRAYHASRRAIEASNRAHATTDRPFARPAGSVTPPPDPHERLGHVRLERNFRSRGALVAFTNHFFDPIFQPEGDTYTDHEARPGALEPHRDESDGGPGTVRLIVRPRARDLADDGDEDEDTDAGVWQRLAETVRDDVDGPEPLLIHPREGPARSARYEDCAILVARTTHMADILRELRAAGVPYVVAGGRTFWDNPEIWDIHHLVATLVEPSRDLALLGLLRSPLLAWPDSAIAVLMQHDGSSVWARLHQAARAGVDVPGAPESPAALVARIRRWRAHRADTSFGNLVEQILAETGYAAALAPDDRHVQAVHNLDKAIAHLRALETRHGADPSRILRSLDAVLAGEPHEAEAVVPDDAESGVRIMTIHAAKGLEFPVVYLPDLDRRFRNDTLAPYTPYVRGEIDGHPLLGANAPDDDGHDRPTLLVSALREQAARRARAESKRLLYVAMTRARDHLVLCGTTKRAGQGADAAPPLAEGTSWLDWCEHLLGLTPDVYQTALREGRVVRRFATVPYTLDLRPPGQGLAHATPAAATPASPLPLPADPPRPPPLVVLTPSALETYHDCPKRFHLRHVVGAPEPRPVRAQRRDEDHATVIGTLVHQALETGATRDDPLPAPVARRLRRKATLLGRDPAPLERDVRRHVGHALRLLSDRDGLHEVAFDHALAPGVRLRGRLDRLEPDPDGWRIIDYKTDDTTASPAMVATQRGHLRQIGAYRAALERAGHAVKARLLYTGTGAWVDGDDDATLPEVLALIAAGAEATWPTRPAAGRCSGCGFWARRGGPCAGWQEPPE